MTDTTGGIYIDTQTGVWGSVMDLRIINYKIPEFQESISRTLVHCSDDDIKKIGRRIGKPIRWE